MKNGRIVEIVKNVIMEDLLCDVNSQKCVLDIIINDSKEAKKIKKELNKVSIYFLDKCGQQLTQEYMQSPILFFRKYGYEKILNEHLAKIYDVGTLELNLFTNQEIDEYEKRIIKEEIEHVNLPEIKINELEDILKQREDVEQEKKILNHIGRLSWKKVMNVSGIIYSAVLDGKRIEFEVNSSTKNKNTSINYVLKYNKQPIRYTEYDGKTIEREILQTHPKSEHNKHIIYVNNADNLAREKALEEKEKKRKQEEALKRQQQQEEERKLKEEIKEEKRRLKEERVKAQEEINRLKRIEKIERIRKLEEEQQAQYQELLQIRVKDFVVRRAIFKCMHSKHKVKDLAAAVRVVGDDGKDRLTKISAGYCEQCKVYFIMESTYEKLRKMGVVLCRICDEKTYMKNSFVNGMHLAQESILMQFGYTVAQGEGLSEARRQKILAVMIDNKILSKSEIISYLDFFISQRQTQSRYEVAVAKWEIDREFVQEYKVGEYTQHGVSAIFRK